MAPPTRVLFVRHGQSEWNLTGRWQGQADPPLTDLGRTQARTAARALGQMDAIWSSDLQRAAESAAIIGDELGVGPVVLDKDLRERDVGEWSGLTRDEIDQQYPGYLSPADGDGRRSAVRRPPSWEEDAAVMARVTAALHRMHAEIGPGGEILAVAHAGIIYALERGLGAAGARLGNLDGRRFEIRAGEIAVGERVVLLEPDQATVPPNL